MSQAPEDDGEEFDVGVTFYGDDWGLTVAWSTNSTTDDETRIDAVCDFFQEKYGWDPGEHANDIKILPMP